MQSPSVLGAWDAVASFRETDLVFGIALSPVAFVSAQRDQPD